MKEKSVRTNLFVLKGKIIDGTGVDPIEKGALLVREGKIADVGPEREVEIPKDAKVIDVSDKKTIIPGVIDFHNHYIHLRPYKWYYDSPYGIAKSVLLAQKNAENWIKAGITTLRDHYDGLPGVVALKDMIEAGRLLGPRTYLKADARKTGPEELKKETEEIIAKGEVHDIAINTSGSYTQQTLYKTTRTIEEVKAVVKVAHSHGMKVEGQSHNPEACIMCCKAGVDFIGHGVVLDDEALEMIKKVGAYWAPIIYTFVKSAEYDIRIPDSDIGVSDKTPPIKRAWQKEMKHQLYKILKPNVRKAHEMGIKILPGSDIAPPREEAIIINPNNMVCELDYLMKWSGMTPMETLMSTTKYQAEALGEEDKIGTLEKGKIADVVVCDGDPLKNLRKALDPSRIWFVMKDGKPMYCRG